MKGPQASSITELTYASPDPHINVSSFSLKFLILSSSYIFFSSELFFGEGVLQ
jgi:hypothetical protein